VNPDATYSGNEGAVSVILPHFVAISGRKRCVRLILFVIGWVWVERQDLHFHLDAGLGMSNFIGCFCVVLLEIDAVLPEAALSGAWAT
jgi:hypothetical protein